MNSIIPSPLMASLTESPAGSASGVPSVAMPRTTGVLVIETARPGVTPLQVMAVIPAEFGLP